MRDTSAQPAVLAGSPTRLSADGAWWWDGARWQAAISPDGLWRWDGERWQPALDVDTEDPAAVAALFDSTADQRFAAAGQLLATRRTEWSPQSDEVAQLVARVSPSLDRQGGQAGLSSLLGRLAGDDPADLHQQLALLGRMAPEPSLPEADELRASARALEERGLELQKARAELEEQEARHRQRIEEAMQKVAEAKTAREAALADVEARVRAAELEREHAVEDISRALRGMRMPGPGEELARVQEAVLYSHRVETADGRGPVDGAEAHVGTAPALWKAHRSTLAELLRLEVAGAVRFHESLTAEGDEEYLLLLTRHVRSIVPFPPGDGDQARAFAKALQAAAGGSDSERRAWEEQVRAAEEALEVAIGDATRVDAARAELERRMADPELEAPIREAERGLRAAEREPAALAAARQRVQDAVAGLLKPPAPLRPAAES
ncbi:MAG TPA: hypothetical protein VF160_00655 [Candidatus Dormibacteraeota bacterium]